MDQTIRYGIIGAGNMGCEHIRNIALTPAAVVTAIADPFAASRAAAVAAAGPDITAYADYRALLDDAAIDAVVIATPNHTHAAVLDDTFPTGKHILVEKPLCTTLTDCRRATTAANAHPGVVWVAMEYRYMPPVARLLEEVRGGAVGRLRMVAIREHRYPFLHKVGDWNRFNRNTGGTMVEKCCHFFDLMRLATGARPTRIYASGGHDVNHLDERYDGEMPDIIDNAFVTVDFEDGTRALLDLCMFAEGSRDEHEVAITGDTGKVECAMPSSTLLHGRCAPKSLRIEHIAVPAELLAAGNHHGSTYYEHLGFQRAIRNGTPPEVTVEDGLMAVAMGLAAERSIAERRPVDLSELGL